VTQPSLLNITSTPLKDKPHVELTASSVRQMVHVQNAFLDSINMPMDIVTPVRHTVQNSVRMVSVIDVNKATTLIPMDTAMHVLLLVRVVTTRLV